MALLDGKKAAPENLGRVLVLGLGKSGTIAARYCLDLLGTRVESLTIAAGSHSSTADAFAATAEAAGARVLFDHFELSDSYDLCIASPGISQFGDFYLSAQAASTQIISEVEFAWRESDVDSRWVAITGTNGKTTTTACAAHLLQQCGLNAAAVGNIGDTCLEAVAAGKTQVYVAEVSSYQLASTVNFAPNVAVLLNITPDHIKWHRTHEAYVAAKLRVFANLAEVPGAVAVLDACNDTVRETVKQLHAQSPEQRGFDYIPLGAADGMKSDMRTRCGSENAAFVRAEDNRLVVALHGTEHALCAIDELRIPGMHNASNALAAACAALALGCSDAAVTDALKSFAPLEHRVEPCGSVNGVACYNDSKATNVDATLKALSAFGDKRPIVLLGGDDKGTSLDELVQAANAHCKAVVCFGASQKRFLEAFEAATIPVYQAATLEPALDVALQQAQQGDVVVLSPACASFDEFTCFEQRGQVFKDLVAQRAAG